MGIFLLVMSLVAISYQPPRRVDALSNEQSKAAIATLATRVASGSVDQLVATNIAVNIAERGDLPIKNSVSNLSQSLAAESLLAQTDTNVISKPQIVAPTVSNQAAQTYVTVAGDTVPTLAARHNITVNTLKWANNLNSDALEPGKTLTIPRTDGVLYTVKAGDTVDSIATRYKADRSIITAFNNLELGGLTPGKQITIPDGDLPENERPGYVAPRANRTPAYGNYGSGGAINSSLLATRGNGYAFGNCTWYAYERRIQLGLPVGSNWGNASTWSYFAGAAGLAVSGNPTAGAIMQDNFGYYGHVAIVESVNPGVSITISEMNGYRWGGGFNRVARGDIPWGDAVSGKYRYIQ